MSDLHQAIREHLALKRQHGADPSEVARQEQEAFGEFSSDARVDFATAYPSEPHSEFEPFAASEAVAEPFREEFVPQTNEYARASLHAHLESGEETQEYTIDDRVGWSIGPAWRSGTA
jgi:hypothetical protein